METGGTVLSQGMIKRAYERGGFIGLFRSQTSQLVAPSDGRDTAGQVDPSVHGSGPVQVSVSGFLTDIDPIAEAASKELGGRFEWNVDYNSGNFVGTCE